MDEIAEGKARFLDLVKGLDPAVEVVIPTVASNSLFLISLTKGANRKFISVPEDDMLDLVQEADVRAKVTKMVQDTIATL